MKKQEELEKWLKGRPQVVEDIARKYPPWETYVHKGHPDTATDFSGAICGGVISESKQKADCKKYGVWANAMSYVMPDKEFKKYKALKEAHKDKEAKKLFDEHAWSMI